MITTLDDVRLYDEALSASQVEELHDVTKGTIVTDKRTGTEISKQDLKANYEADIASGENIKLTVYAEWKSGKVKTDTVTLSADDSGSGTVSLSGINKDADTFWVRAELNSASTKTTPELKGISLLEGS